MRKLLSILKRFFKSKTFFTLFILIIMLLFISVAAVVITDYYSQYVTRFYSVKNATVAEIQEAFQDILGRSASIEELNTYSSKSIEIVRSILMSSSERKTIEANTEKQTEESTTITDGAIQGASVTTKSSATPVDIKPSAYVASVCTKTILPFETIYKDDIYLEKGKTWFTPGFDGYVQTCTADSNGYKPQDNRLEPSNKTVWVGVKKTDAEIAAEHEALRLYKYGVCIETTPSRTPWKEMSDDVRPGAVEAYCVGQFPPNW